MATYNITTLTQQAGRAARGSRTALETVLRALLDLASINVDLTNLTATADEINAVADVSGRLVTLTGDTTITAALHAGRTCLLGEVGGDAALVVTLPAATGTGDRYRFVVSVADIVGYTIKVADNTDTFNGMFWCLDNDSTALTAYAANGGDDTLTLNATTKTGLVGDWFEVEDIATNTWAVRGAGIVPAGSNIADVFSATV